MFKIVTNDLAYHFYSRLCAKVDTVFARAHTFSPPHQKCARLRRSGLPFGLLKDKNLVSIKSVCQERNGSYIFYSKAFSTFKTLDMV